MAYKMKSSGLPFKQLGSSPAKQTKEIKGTSIFGKTPKNFAKDAIKNLHVSGYNTIKSIYNKISGSKTYVGKKAPKHEVVHPEVVHPKITPEKKEEKKMMMKKEFKRIKRTTKTKQPAPKPSGGFMHPPYRKPAGPIEGPHYVHGYKKTK